MNLIHALLFVWLGSLPPPLVQALRAARSRNHSLRVSRAQLAEQEAAAQQALAALLPTLQASGGYTRNQYDAIFTVPNALLGRGAGTSSLTIQPYDQWNGAVGIVAPLFDGTRLFGEAEARRGRDAARHVERATEAEVALATARAYYQVVASQGIVDASVRALATAQDSLRVAEAMLKSGSATRLSVDRARVDLERAGKQLASARQGLGLARRNLETLTGEPAPEALPAPGEPDLPALPEAAFVEKAEREREEVAEGRESVARAEDALRAAWARFLPTLSAAAHEYYTNAPGFLPSDNFWTAGVSLGWSLDPFGTSAAIKQARAAVEEQRERLAETEDAVRDEVHSSWLEIEADRAQLVAAVAESASARDALELTQTQFRSGTATSLDVSQASRDSFSADASLAQSRAGLAAALLSLEKASGQPLLEESP